MTNREWTKADPEWCRIETVVHSITIEEATQKVITNRGSAGVDHVTVEELRDYWNNTEKQSARKSLKEPISRYR